MVILISPQNSQESKKLSASEDLVFTNEKSILSFWEIGDLLLF